MRFNRFLRKIKKGWSLFMDRVFQDELSMLAFSAVLGIIISLLLFIPILLF